MKGRPGQTWRGIVSAGEKNAAEPRFEERKRVDSIDYIEDIPIGLQIETFTGWQRRDGEDSSDDQLAASFGALLIESFGASHLLSANAAGQLRYDGDLPGWAMSSFLHYYYQGLPSQTLVFGAAYDANFESEDLFTQLTLGEDSGLRGYPTREFSGHKRIRFNIEDRIFTGISILSMHVGGAVFFDAGMVWDRGESIDPSDLAKSVGVGLRFGSKELLGKKVLRIDFAYPLDKFDGEDYGLSISATVDQVIELHRNTEQLDNEFSTDF